MKKLLALGDTHCGSKSGLTPPKFQCSEQQEVYWDAFAKMLAEYKKGGQIDIALWNGDLVDGEGTKSGGVEEDTTNQYEQVKIAQAVVEYVGAKQNIFTLGTPYHAGTHVDFEEILADRFDSKISGQQYFQVNKTTFHAKHKVGSSAIPHGRFTGLARQKMWNLFWSEHEEAPKVDVFLRSHTHYHCYCGDDKWMAMVLPALQGWGAYGERECEGTVHFGFVGFWIGDNGGLPAWRAYVCRSARRATVQKF